MKKSKLFEEFKAFITRGNVVDMAVGVVVGAAFSKIVTGLVNYIINPFVGLFVPKGGLDGIKTVITPAVLAEDGSIVTPETAILWGTWLQTIIDFLIVALVIFFAVRWFTRVKKRISEKIAVQSKKEPEEKKEEAPPKPTQEEILIEIRDLLKERKESGDGGSDVQNRN